MSKSTRSSPSGRLTRSQLEAQAKLKALYAESHSKENNPAGENTSSAQRLTRSKAAQGNANSIDSMSPNILMVSNDNEKPEGGGNDALKSAVTPSPKPDKAGSPSPAKAKVETAEELRERAERRANWPMTNIMEPGENDCLFGRGGGTNHHPGNKRYRKAVEDKKGKYLASKRLDKPLVAMEIINDWRALDPPGRFLKQDDNTKLWNDVGDKKAREKTSQALREKTPVKQREDYDPRAQRTARFEPGTSSPVGRYIKRGELARDHSLGETFVGNDISLEGFSWDEKDRPVVSNADANVREGHPGHPPPPSHHQHGPPPYPYAREHSFEEHPPPPPYYGHHYPGYGPPPPPPPPGHPHPPPPYASPPYSHPDHHHHYYAQHPPPHPQQRSREHSLQMNPLKGASTSQPARDTFTDDESHASSYSGPPPLPSPTYDGRPPPLPPLYYGGYAPSPTNGWPAPPPPPTPQFTYQPGSNPSAFGRYNSGDRSNSIRSLGSSVDAFYDKRDSNASSGSHHSASRESKKDTNMENPASAGSSQDYSKIAELIRDSSDKSSGVERSASWNENGGKDKGEQDEVPRSRSMPYEDSGSAVGRPDGVEGTEEEDKRATPSGVHKSSLIRKLSGGAMARPNMQPPAGILRPEPVNGRPDLVKRDTSHQPETVETKRSVKRVVLSRDQSMVARRLKEEQLALQGANGRPVLGARVSSRLTKAEMLDRNLSVEINKLGLEDYDTNGAGIPLNRMTTEDVLGSLIDDDEIGSAPEPIAEGDRVTTIDAIAMDIANGKPESEWEDALDLVDEPGPVAVASPDAGVDADIAEKWLKGSPSTEE